MTAAQFVNIGTSTAMPLESILPTGDDVSDSVSIMTLDAFGRTVDTYDWNDWAQDEPCWVDGDFEKVEGVTFEVGQGLWVIGGSTSQGIQTAGAVGKADVSVTLRNGGTATANPFPTTLNLQDVLPTGDDVSDSVSIMTLDAFGRTVDTYDWNDWAQDEPCWVNGDFEKVEGVTFEAGQGLWVIGASTTQGIVFPAPEL